jgi:hypothetical protein
MPREADSGWRPGRVYFLTLLEPLAGTTGLWPLPPGRPASVTVGQLKRDHERFTAHAASFMYRQAEAGSQCVPVRGWFPGPAAGQGAQGSFMPISGGPAEAQGIRDQAHPDLVLVCRLDRVQGLRARSRAGR